MSNESTESAASSGQGYRRRSAVRVAILGAVFAGVVFVALLDMVLGPANLTWSEMWSTVWHPAASDPIHRTILWSFRLPTMLLAISVGAALGVAGAEMQTILNNPLASPFTLGISAAASFGAAIVLVGGASTMAWGGAWLVPISAFVFTLLCALAIYFIGRRNGASTDTIVVGGVALHFLFSSGVAFLQFVAAEDALQAIVFWIFGSLQGANWTNVAIVSAVLLVVCLVLSRNAWQLTALRLGDEHAQSLGVNVAQVRLQTLVLVSIVTATAVCFTGTIGFVGLVAPHVARSLVGEDQRFFMPLSGLLGAILVCAADVISKSLVPETTFPIGIVTAAIGAPCLAFIALAMRRAYQCP
ncbi:iron ABC transporter permease [Bremerella cremea]|uniref:Iron ABC transporter permease n=1 Tax=Bremerella cremea TaxID=1031537 RepID=A0A368KKP1_9BACT|nr:iron ABC transporter permease [Bremerella cremea]RCS41319.1 iron ABC transporter permease [Bremerella cremea]